MSDHVKKQPDINEGQGHELIPPTCSEPEYFKRCGDCGKFVDKSRWIRKDNPYGYTHALCRECHSLYDDPYCY